MSLLTTTRGRVGAIFAGVVALVASVLTVAPAQAAAAAVNLSYGTINRSVAGNEFVVGPSETVRFNFYVSLGSSYFTDSPITGSTVFTVSMPSVSAGAATAGSTSYNWDYSGTNQCWGSSMTSSITVSATCTTYLNLSAGVSYTNSTGSDVTITFDTSSATILRDGVSTGATGSASAYRTLSNSPSSFSIRSDSEDSNFNGTFSACLASEKLSSLAQGDELTIDFDVKVDGADQTLVDGVTNNTFTPDGVVEINAYDFGATSAYTYTVPQGFSSTTEIRRELYVRWPNGGTWTATMTVKDSDGVTVAGECSYGPPPSAPLTYPSTISAPSGTATTLPYTQASKVIGAGLTSLTAAVSNDDGAGGKLYAAVNSGSAKVIQITPTGVSTKFAKVGKATIASVTSIGSVGVYNSKKNWFATSGNPMTGYKIHSGSMTASSSVTTKSVTTANLNKACGGTGYSASSISGIPSVLTLPIVSIRCMKTSNMGSFSVIAKITPTSGAVTKIVQLGNVGTAATANCVLTSSGTNLGASGSVNAFVAYVATATSDNPGCMTYSAFTKREIVTITAAGATKTTTISGNPWGSSVSDEPTMLSFAPGKTAGSWIGTAMIGGMMSPPTGTRLFSVSATRALSVKAGTILNSDAALSTLAYPMFYPVKEISTSKWSLKVEDGAGVDTLVTGLSTVNPTTGTVTLGELLTVSGYGSYNDRPIINNSAWSADGKLRHYVISDATHVSISSWTSPSS